MQPEWTPELERRVREACEKATPGPWYLRGEGRGRYSHEREAMVYSCRVRFFFPNISALASYDRNADFAFIDEARTALPAALAEIERLRRRNAYLEKYVGSTVPSKAQAALAEVERLRARLAGAADAAQGISLPTFDDERLRYVEVQIDREDLEVLRRLDIELFGIDPESVRAAEAELDRGERVTPEEIEEESDGD